MSAFALLHGNAGFLAAVLKGYRGRMAQAQESPGQAPVLVATAGPQGAPGCCPPRPGRSDFSGLSQAAPLGLLHKGPAPLMKASLWKPPSLEGAFLPQPLGL